MRDVRRFEKLSGPRMSVSEFAGEIPTVYDRLAEFAAVLDQSQSVNVIRSEWNRLFGMENGK